MRKFGLKDAQKLLEQFPGLERSEFAVAAVALRNKGIKITVTEEVDKKVGYIEKTIEKLRKESDQLERYVDSLILAIRGYNERIKSAQRAIDTKKAQIHDLKEVFGAFEVEE